MWIKLKYMGFELENIYSGFEFQNKPVHLQLLGVDEILLYYDYKSVYSGWLIDHRRRIFE